MHRLHVILASSLVLLAPSLAWAQAVQPAAVDELVLEALAAWEVPGAALVVVQNERVVYLKGYGVRELGSKQPVTPDTVFCLASCTKAFTTTALAMLVEQGKLAWDDPVRKHVPFFRLADPLADENVTIRDLLCHRTGVATHDLLVYRTPWGLEEQVRRIGKVQPSRSFRSAFQYQSAMFIAAGLALESASGASWKDFVQDRILKPLEMTGASLTTAEAMKSRERASGHRRNKDGKIGVVPWYAFDVPNPTGSVNASARDLGKWLQFQLNEGTYQKKRLVAAEHLAETHTPQMIIRLEGLNRAEHPFTTQLSYGMGWVIQDYRGHKLVSHAGIMDGLRVHITLVPEARLGLAILSNLHGTRMNLAVNNTLLDHLFQVPAKNWDWNRHYQGIGTALAEQDKAWEKQRQEARRPGTRPSLPPPAYAGVYEQPAYGTARIILENGALVWQWSTFRCKLEHYHFDSFVLRDDLLPDPMATFSLGADGQPATLRVLAPGVVDVEFKRVK